LNIMESLCETHGASYECEYDEVILNSITTNKRRSFGRVWCLETVLLCVCVGAEKCELETL
jgi:hypothetical protein